MRLIDADELCDDVDNYEFTEHSDYSNVRDMIDYAPTIDAEPDKGWISVKNRLPENDGLYIVCKTINGHQIVFEAYWKGNKWLSVIKNNQLDYVTHWQPLPEPPVKHGRWLETNDATKKRCSECDVIHLIAQYPHGNANYCPNCGAIMDGGETK